LTSLALKFEKISDSLVKLIIFVKINDANTLLEKL